MLQLNAAMNFKQYFLQSRRNVPYNVRRWEGGKWKRRRNKVKSKFFTKISTNPQSVSILADDDGVKIVSVWLRVQKNIWLYSPETNFSIPLCFSHDEPSRELLKREKKEWWKEIIISRWRCVGLAVCPDIDNAAIEKGNKVKFRVPGVMTLESHSTVFLLARFKHNLSRADISLLKL